MNHQARILHWPTCYNVRDLGGLPTAADRFTEMGAIVRADLPARLTPLGQQLLVDHGIRTILDLRKPEQVAESPSIFMTAGEESAADNSARPTYLNISLENHSAAIDAQMNEAGHARATVYALMLDHNPLQIAQIMRAIVDARPGGILIHCSAGKDRTGLVAALLLALAGVPDEIIAEDYALSERALWPLYEEMVAAVGGEEQLGWWLKPIAKPEMMLATLSHLLRRYGGAVGYLRQAGLSEPAQIRLRKRLLSSTISS